MIHSLIPSLPFTLRYPRDIAVYPETSQLSVFPFTRWHRHATNAVRRASHVAPVAGRDVPVVAFTFGMLHGFSYTCQPFRNGLISMIATAMFCVFAKRAYTFT